jgi:hypothetical protein
MLYLGMVVIAVVVIAVVVMVAVIAVVAGVAFAAVTVLREDICLLFSETIHDQKSWV